MNKNPFAAILAGLLFLSAALSAVFALTYAFSSRDLRRIQPQAMGVNNHLNLVQALLNETLEYSKRNPAIDPLLFSLNLKTNASAAGTPPSIVK
ncbi:MAG TPA: hypothetical protein VJW76_14695 [Verrucomicrobiae bacterium]|nr:hypothetical protein [Verrucomicrobiae bacterium]